MCSYFIRKRNESGQLNSASLQSPRQPDIQARSGGRRMKCFQPEIVCTYRISWLYSADSCLNILFLLQNNGSEFLTATRTIKV